MMLFRNTNNKFLRLKMELAEAGISADYLAELIGKSESYTRERLRGERPWAADEMYHILDELNIPHKKLNKYFPAEDMKTYENPKEKKPSGKTAKLSVIA